MLHFLLDLYFTWLCPVGEHYLCSRGAVSNNCLSEWCEIMSSWCLSAPLDHSNGRSSIPAFQTGTIQLSSETLDTSFISSPRSSPRGLWLKQGLQAAQNSATGRSGRFLLSTSSVCFCASWNGEKKRRKNSVALICHVFVWSVWLDEA